MFYEAEITVRPIPPLELGDEFMPSGVYEQDVVDLRAIYGASESSMPLSWLVATAESGAEKAAALRERQLRDGVAETPLVRLLRDCRRSFDAHQALWAD